MKKLKEYRTSDLVFATTALYFQFQLLKTEGNARTIFVFEDTSDLRDLEVKYLTDSLSVSPRKFIGLLRDIKGIVSKGRKK